MNTIRASIETEDIQRGAEPGDFLQTNRKDLEPPVLRFLNFDEQGTPTVNIATRSPGLYDRRFFVPGKKGTTIEVRISVPDARTVVGAGHMNVVFLLTLPPFMPPTVDYPTAVYSRAGAAGVTAFTPLSPIPHYNGR